jgi:hypothetical protein
MRADNSFRINIPNIISGIIDGEAVFVNLETGIYYSIDKIGALIWSFIENEMPMGQIIDTIAGRCDGSSKDVEYGMNQLVTKLSDEKLIYIPAPMNPLKVRILTPMLIIPLKDFFLKSRCCINIMIWRDCFYWIQYMKLMEVWAGRPQIRISHNHETSYMVRSSPRR